MMLTEYGAGTVAGIHRVSCFDLSSSLSLSGLTKPIKNELSALFFNLKRAVWVCIKGKHRYGQVSFL